MPSKSHAIFLTRKFVKILKIEHLDLVIHSARFTPSMCRESFHLFCSSLVFSLRCPLPAPRALLCVINYDCAGWQHTATVLINYQQWEELFFFSILVFPPFPFPLSLSTFFLVSLSFHSFLLQASEQFRSIPEPMINVFSTLCSGTILLRD